MRLTFLFEAITMNHHTKRRGEIVKLYKIKELEWEEYGGVFRSWVLGGRYVIYKTFDRIVRFYYSGSNLDEDYIKSYTAKSIEDLKKVAKEDWDRRLSQCLDLVKEIDHD